MLLFVSTDTKTHLLAKDSFKKIYGNSIYVDYEIMRTNLLY